LPPLPEPVENQRVGRRSLEIRALSAMLPPGSDDVERAVLSRAALDRDDAARRGHSLPVRGVPLQFRELPSVQGETELAQYGRGGVREAIEGTVMNRERTAD